MEPMQDRTRLALRESMAINGGFPSLARVIERVLMTPSSTNNRSLILTPMIIQERAASSPIWYTP
jgi:hypothetical protein